MANDNVAALLGMGGGSGSGGGGSGSAFIVNVTETGGVYSADKTFAEIYAAKEAGKIVLAMMDQVCYQPSELEVDYATFINNGLSPDGDYSVVNRLRVDENDAWTANDATFIPEENVVYVTGATPSIAAADNTVYKCGTLTSLTVSSFPASGKFEIIFYSGATASTVTGIDNFTPEANKRYRIRVEYGYATFDSWDWTGV